LRDGLQAKGLPERSGFQVDPKALPPGWGGREVWCTFDQQGLFRLPQEEKKLVLPASPNPRSEVVQAIQSDTNLKAGNLQTNQEWPITVPEDLRQHWQALEKFRLYLDKIEQELDARDNRQLPAKKVFALPIWWPRLLGGAR
jgi:hypothetical protein